MSRKVDWAKPDTQKIEQKTQLRSLPLGFQSILILALGVGAAGSCAANIEAILHSGTHQQGLFGSSALSLQLLPKLDYINQASNTFVFDDDLGKLIGTTVIYDPDFFVHTSISLSQPVAPMSKLLEVSPRTTLDNAIFRASRVGELFTTVTTYCPGVVRICTGTWPAELDFPKWQKFASQTAGRRLGPAMTLTASANVVPVASGSVVTQWDFDATVSATYTYTPFSASEYVRGAIERTRVSNQPLDADAVAGRLQELRKFDAATSSQNMALRDAEYFVLGFIGGQTWQRGPAQVIHGILALGPLTLAPWKALSAIEGQLSTGNLPGTPLDAASFTINTSGWFGAFFGFTLEETVEMMDDGPQVIPVSAGLGSVESPFLPLRSAQSSNTSVGTTSFFGISEGLAVGGRVNQTASPAAGLTVLSMLWDDSTRITAMGNEIELLDLRGAHASSARLRSGDIERVVYDPTVIDIEATFGVGTSSLEVLLEGYHPGPESFIGIGLLDSANTLVAVTTHAVTAVPEPRTTDLWMLSLLLAAVPRLKSLGSSRRGKARKSGGLAHSI